MSITGTWDTRMKTPIGSVEAVFTFTEIEGIVHGVAVSSGTDAPLRDIVITPSEDGDLVTWSQSVTKPMRLNLDFEVTVKGDSFSGFSKAGRLPKSRVEGVRAVTMAG